MHMMNISICIRTYIYTYIDTYKQRERERGEIERPIDLLRCEKFVKVAHTWNAR